MPMQDTVKKINPANRAGLIQEGKHMTSKTNDTTEWYEVELARRFIDARMCAKSILFRIIGTGGDFDGWSFFHPRTLCKFIPAGKGTWSISYQDGWEFKLTKRGKNEQGEWVNVGECTLTPEELTEQLLARQLVHKPEYLPPLANVEVPKELIDE